MAAKSKILEVGSKAPAFTLPTDSGKDVKLSELAGKSIVLYFYPKDDTSGCTREAVEFSAAEKAFKKAKTVVIGVSKDSVERHKKFRDKHDLTVELASDEAGKVLEKYGVWVEKALYGRKYMGIERSTFLIDAKGVIRGVWRKVRVAGHVEAVLKAAQDLAKAK